MLRSLIDRIELHLAATARALTPSSMVIWPRSWPFAMDPTENSPKPAFREVNSSVVAGTRNRLDLQLRELLEAVVHS